MTIQIITRSDALRHTGRRVAVVVSLTVAMTAATTLLHLGTDLNANVAVGHVIFSSICAAAAISTLLAGALIFRSALLMQQLTLRAASCRRFRAPIN